MPTRIVTTHYRYKRPPRKRKAVALEVPAVVTRLKRSKKGPLTLPGIGRVEKLQAIGATEKPGTASGRVTNDNRKSAIVTARRRKHAMHAHLLEAMTPEEVQRRGDAADALWRELVRRVRENRS